MFLLHEEPSFSLGQEVYAMNPTADGAVSQPEAVARPKQSLLHLCAEGLKNNIHCCSRGRIRLDYRELDCSPNWEMHEEHYGMRCAYKQCWMELTQTSRGSL